MSDDFHTALDALHGRANADEGKIWGHNLFKRLKILNHNPNMRFIERLFKNYIEILQIRDRKTDLQQIMKAVQESSEVDDEVLEEICQRQIVIHAEYERIFQEELALIEEADEFRTAGGQPTPLPSVQIAA